MGIVVFNNQEYEVSYNKEELIEFRQKVLDETKLLRDMEEDTNLDNDYYYGVPYIVSLIDRLLFDDYEAIREVFRPDISKERFPIKREINKIIKELNTTSLDIDEKIELTDELKQLYYELKYEEIYLRRIMKYYFELMNMISLNKVKTLSR